MPHHDEDRAPQQPPADFADERSQRLLDAMADALADALGEQMALEYLAETGDDRAGGPVRSDGS